MTVPSGAYTLTAMELASVRSLLHFQDSYSESDSVTPATLDAFLTGLDSLSHSFGAIKNPRFLAYYGDVFDPLTRMPAVGGYTFAQIFIMNAYARSCDMGDILYKGNPIDYFPFDFGWTNFWHGFLKGYTYTTTCDSDWNDDERQVSAWSTPLAPPTWHAAIAGLLTQWGEKPPANYIDLTNHLYTRKYGSASCYWASPKPLYVSQKGRINSWLTSWPTATPTIMQTIAPLWAAQHQDALALLDPMTLPADDYFFLLYLLPALATGDAASLKLANQIVSAPVNSVEYPNDTFGNQLVYLVLMYLADPLGTYGWNNAQLQTAVKDLESVVVKTDPASAALLTSLQQHEKILNSDASYPLSDPYNPSIGFNQRKTDTLFALDKARAALKAGGAQ